MGDEKWTRRGPGSASGSFVPPPVVAGEPRTRAPLPRRWPRSDRRASQAAAGGAGQTQSQPVEEQSRPVQERGQQAQVPGAASAAAPGPPPAASLPASPAPTAASSSAGPPASSRAGPSASSPAGPPASPAGPPPDASTDPVAGRTSGTGPRRLQLAEPQAPAASPQLPDNVRYLFKPVLNEPADPTEPVEAAGTKAGTKTGTKAGTQKVDRDRTSPAGARPPARHRAPSAAFQRTATAPATDRLAEPDRSPETEPAPSPRPAADQPQPATHPATQPATRPATQPAQPAASTSIQPRWLAWLRTDSTSAQDAPADRTPLRRHLAWAAAVAMLLPRVSDVVGSG